MERPDLDFLVSEDQALLRDTVRSFGQEQVAPRHEALDHAGVHPADVVAGMADLGLFGILAPAEAGGVGMGMLAHVISIEELAAAGGLAGAILAAHGVGIDILASAGSPFAGSLLGGTSFAAPAFEPCPGMTDVAADAQGRLTGAKAAVPFPGRAGAWIVLARDAAGKPALYSVEGGAKGATHAGRDEALGLLGFETAPLVLQAAPATRLGGEDLVARAMASARIQVAALLCGIGRGAVAHATRYAHERKQFDRPLADFVAIQERLARGAARVAAARALVHDAARLKDRGEPFAVAAAQARLIAGEAAVQTADDGLQVFGGYGYSREYPAERFYRDSRFVGFGEGDAAAMIATIAKDLG
jgi:alkylation response protein AidB-like acyl-CoA dehydrogenase